MFRVSDDDPSRWYEKTRCALRATAVTGSKAIELPLEVELGSRFAAKAPSSDHNESRQVIVMAFVKTRQPKKPRQQRAS